MLQILSEKLWKFVNLNERFVLERMLCNTKSIYDTVCKNDFALFPSKNSIVTNKSIQKIVSLQAERLLYANLYLACQSRDGDGQLFYAWKSFVPSFNIRLWQVEKVFNQIWFSGMCKWSSITYLWSTKRWNESHWWCCVC